MDPVVASCAQLQPAYDGKQPSELEKAQQLVRDILSKHAADSSQDAQEAAAFVEQASFVQSTNSNTLAPNTAVHETSSPTARALYTPVDHFALPGPFVAPTFVAPPVAPAPFERRLDEFTASA